MSQEYIREVAELKRVDRHHRSSGLIGSRTADVKRPNDQLPARGPVVGRSARLTQSRSKAQRNQNDRGAETRPAVR